MSDSAATKCDCFALSGSYGAHDPACPNASAARGRLWSLKRPVRVFRDPIGFHIFVGPWACRVSWDRQGHFANGSHYFTGWHRWEEDAEISCSSTK